MANRNPLESATVEENWRALKIAAMDSAAVGTIGEGKHQEKETWRMDMEEGEMMIYKVARQRARQNVREVSVIKDKNGVLVTDEQRIKPRCGIKPLEHGTKVLEMIIEKRPRRLIITDDTQSGFSQGKGTMDAVFIIKQLQEKHLEVDKDLYFTFVDQFNYLGVTVSEKGTLDSAIKARVTAAWTTWRELSGVTSDRKMPRKLKIKGYSTIIKPVLLYGAESWTMRAKDEKILEITGMRKIKGVTLRDRKRSERARKELVVIDIKEQRSECDGMIM
ncbi:uncharacterized protein LOC134762233 [Penaeus indicus]|uniref:uncharacterized protein LOC134762233 n=1 Tax=Penaeus indicus TaxID=29960 RepID=UPI00300C12B0